MLAYNRQTKHRLRDVVRELGPRYLRGRLVDIGCGYKPYERDLRGIVSEHVGVDYEQTPYDLSRVDIVATAYSVPVADDSFDCALATEVLEHLEDPVAAVSEWLRIVRPGGHLLVTTPFIWGIHDEPRDFYRYSPFGLRHVMESGGWEVVEIRHLGGFWSTFGQLLAYVIESYDRGPVRRLHLLPVLGAITQRVGGALERRSPRSAWGSHVVAVARRPDSTEHAHRETR
jgi:SAM-dependent methyltransferase